MIIMDPITYWEKVAETKWGSYIANIEKQVILEACRLSEKPGRALDIGCEGGRWSRLLAGSGWEMTCIDVNKNVLDICKERIPNAECILVDSTDTSLPVPAQSMDLILCCEVPPVVNSDWFMADAYRVLVRGGTVVGVVFNSLSFRGLFHRGARVFGKRNKGVDYYDHSYLRWKERLRRSGFKIIREKGFCWFPLTRSSNSGLVPVFQFLENAFRLSSLVNLSPWVAFIATKSSIPE
jgi:SAM-dependent methyltransferase